MKRKLIAGILAGVAMLVLCACGTMPESISLDKDESTVKVGETTLLSAEIEPDDATNRKVTWTSSDTSIATVEDGTVTGVSEGTCTVTAATANGKKADCAMIVSNAPSLQSVYAALEATWDATASDWSTLGGVAKLAGDGSYLSIDTNPLDRKDYSGDPGAVSAIVMTNSILGFPDSVLKSMSETRALDGRQSYSGEYFDASWTYHPDSGLEVMYTTK